MGTIADIQNLPFIKAYTGIAAINEKAVAHTADIGNIPSAIAVGASLTKKRAVSTKKNTVDNTVSDNSDSTASISKTTDNMQINPWAYAGSLLFGVPGAIASGVMALQQGTPESTTVTASGLEPETAASVFQSATTPSTDNSTDLFGSIGQVGDLVIKVAPVLILLGLVSGVTGLFKR